MLKYDTPVAKDIPANLYVDNLISEVNTISKAKDYYDETKMIFNEAAMIMCKWVSNDPRVMHHYKEEESHRERSESIGTKMEG